MNQLAPIVLFVYNRPDHTKQTVAVLKQNPLAAESELFIYSDAAKNEQAQAGVQAVREVIHSLNGFKKVTIIERDQNWGLAASIIDGVTTVVNAYGRIIVLEDDLVVTPNFLQYMNTALDNYQHEQQVIQVSGYMFPIQLDIAEDALFLPLTTSWGWATWQRAWQLFDADAKGYAQLKTDSALRKQFNLGGAYDYFSMLESQLAGRIDSWAVRWQLSAFLNNKLTLYPRHSLVVNAGFDGSGTHGTMTGLLSNSAVLEEFLPKQFPNEIHCSNAWQQVCRALKNRLGIFGKIKSKLKSIIHFSTTWR